MLKVLNKPVQSCPGPQIREELDEVISQEHRELLVQILVLLVLSVRCIATHTKVDRNVALGFCDRCLEIRRVFSHCPQMVALGFEAACNDFGKSREVRFAGTVEYSSAYSSRQRRNSGW